MQRKYDLSEFAPKEKKYDLSEFALNKSENNNLSPFDILIQTIAPTTAFKEPAKVVASDLWNTAKAIPSTLTKAYGEIPKGIDFLKESIPAAYEMIKENPKEAAKNMGAGGIELAGRASNIPPALVDYLQHIGMIKPETAKAFRRPFSNEEVSQTMDKLIGENENKGGKLLRGLVRNVPEETGIGKAVSIFNPLKLGAEAMAKEITNTEKKQIAKHTEKYNSIWDEAQRSGFNNVPIDAQKLSDKLSVIEKYKTPREYQSLEDLILNPTLAKAQSAQSDMGHIARALEEKSRKGSLTTEEKATFEAAKTAEKHIEENMFKDIQGNVNKKLQDQYKNVSSSYRKNVVPYKYNTDIQAFKNREMLAKELMAKLKGGEFRAKKGSAHPRIAAKEMLTPLGLIAGGGLGADYALRKVLEEINNRNNSSAFSGNNGG